MDKQKAKPETHTGAIVRTSPYGFQLEQHAEEGKWINYGNYFEGKKDWDVGDEVTCGVNALGDKMYLNQIDLSIDAKDEQLKSVASGKPVKKSTYAIKDDEKQRSIVRQACLRSAVQFAQTQKSMKLEDVFQVAESMIDFINAEDEVPF